MDFGTIGGLVLGFSLILMSIIIGGSSLMQFWDTPSVLVVGGGAVAAVMIAYPMAAVLKVFGVSKNCFFNKPPNIQATIAQIVSLSETARREGILSLENRMEEIDNKQLALGIRMTVDGMGTDIVENIMRTELEAVATRHEEGKGIIAAVGKYAPAFGMIGTLMGLVMMLAELDPATIGSGMAVALLTTLYGAVVANLVMLPMADKLAFLSSMELMNMEIVIRGVISIQAGENPRVIKQKLETFLPPNERSTEEESPA